MGGLKCVVLFVMVASALQFADAQVLGPQSLINISGMVSCSLNGTIIVNATTPTPPFPNAMVEIVCGGNVIASGLTNGSGMFNIILNQQQILPMNLMLPKCVARVATPLSNCNGNFPSTGFLQSTLQFINTIVQGLLTIVNVVPGAFEFNSV